MKKLIALALLVMMLAGCGSADGVDKGLHMMIVQKYIEQEIGIEDPDIDPSDFAVSDQVEAVKTVDGKEHEHAYLVMGNLKLDGKIVPFDAVTAVDDPDDISSFYVLKFFSDELDHDYDVILE